MMSEQYDSSFFDVGVPVEAEEKKLPSVLLPISNAKAKRRRLPSRTDTDTAVLDHAESADNSAVPPPIITASTIRKRSKKKQKREKSGEIMVGGEINARLPAVDVAPPLKGMFIEERKQLPVYRHRAEICNLVSINDVVLVVAETVSRTRFSRHFSTAYLTIDSSMY